VIGKTVSLTVRSSPDRSEQFEGKLVSANAGQIGIEVRQGEVRQVPLEQLLRAKLKFSW